MSPPNSDAAANGPILSIVWASMLVSPLIIALPVYFFGGVAGIGGLPAEYDLWFLFGGLASASFSLPMMRRFHDAAALPRGAPRDAAYVQRVTAAMMSGLSMAELPFFIGVAGYMAGGYVQTAAILLLVTMALQFRFKPPAR